MLVSAYDVYHGYLPSPSRFQCIPTLTFVDSGGYETGPDYDSSAVYRFSDKAKPWKRGNLRRVLDGWPPHIDAVFVSFDKDGSGRSIRSQIEAAKVNLRRYPKHLHTILLKPTKRSKGLLVGAVAEISVNAALLSGFSSVGVTEKELGRSILERMVTLAKLRMALDKAGITAPLQVFGALDPISSPLYFLAGAEIFDGLTWLRFAYCGGFCIYQGNYTAIHVGISPDDDFAVAKMFSDNYATLRDLQLGMQTFAASGDYSQLGPYGDRMEKAEKAMKAQLGKDG